MLAWFVQDEHYNIKRVQMNTRKKDEINLTVYFYNYMSIKILYELTNMF